MRKIAVVAIKKNFADYIKSDLENFFAPYAEINAYSFEDIDKIEWIDEEFVVMSTFVAFRKIQSKMKPGTVTQVVGFTICRENIEYIEKIPKDRKVLMANVDYKMCAQVMAQIYEAGYHDFDFVPYFGDESTRDKSIDVAVTPNELSMVPPDIKNVINIGERPVDINFILELAEKMGIENIFGTARAKEVKKRFILTSSGIDKIITDRQDKDAQVHRLIELVDNGMLLSDASGIVWMSNEEAKRLVKFDPDGFSVDELFPELKSFSIGKHIKDKLIQRDSGNIAVTINPIYSGGMVSGHIVQLKSFEESEKKQHELRAQAVKVRHKARYTFDDIIGTSPRTIECINVARRIAKSSSSVLITGESGVGKEVFAQSIHNASSRRNKNFVALNCAAIPGQLLESELFGYDEGAFTGAKKGGKIGYFELAHQGTIFLDEIGDMPLALQSKLLRVLEEKTVSRVGSQELIYIDVRVIAATNKDLRELVKAKKFRSDLYYRINVLPLRIYPLRERREDIAELAQYFEHQMGKSFNLTDSAKSRLLNYRWNGNIRELRNTMEYLANIDKETIDTDDLPLSITESEETGSRPLIKSIKNSMRTDNIDAYRNFIYSHWDNIELFADILLALEDYEKKQKKAGRGELQKYMEKHGIVHTEAEIKDAMYKLSCLGFIKSQRGRGGSRIMAEGKELLKEINGLIG